VQRREGVSQPRVNRIAADFNPLALGTITVSERADGTLILIDGAHRTAGARQAGFTGRIPAEVITGLTHEGEAQLFLLLNDTRTPSAVTKFLTSVVKGDTAAVEMNQILTGYGWRVEQASTPGCISAATAIERVYRSAGGTLPDGLHYDVLDRTIEILTAAWEHDSKGMNASLLLGLAQLIGRFGRSVDTKKLVLELQGTRPGIIVGRGRTLTAAQGGTVPSAIAKILTGMHNNKRRTNILPEWVWTR
jgi:hypothetical protein